jgi:predicted TIM-barrel fold metal-dependent hydrolase
MIDVNVYLSRWPFRRVNYDDAASLVEKLRSVGVTQAWCGSFDALLHRDAAAVNTRLVSECRSVSGGLLEPIGMVNPKFPDWQEDMRRCHEVHRMRGIRLHPNYHGYKLDDPLLVELLAKSTERKLIVQIAMTMEDERTQHPLVQVPHVDPAPLAEALDKVPTARVVLLNAFRKLRVAELDRFAASRRVWFDIATLEGTNGLERLVQQIGHERILFGSFAPLYYWEAAELKLRESPLGGVQVEAIRHNNAAGLSS